MVTGSCLCGTVRWQVDGSLDSMSHCHCSMCRKAHGAPFGTYTEAPSESFTWLSGMDAITSFESSPGIIRAFCGTCGSVVPEPFGKDRMVIPAGCLDGDPGVRPSSHIFAASKAPWHVIGDDLPQSDGYTNPDDGPNVDRPGPGQRQEGVLRSAVVCAAMSPMRCVRRSRPCTIVIARVAARHGPPRMRPMDSPMSMAWSLCAVRTGSSHSSCRQHVFSRRSSAGAADRPCRAWIWNVTLLLFPSGRWTTTRAAAVTAISSQDRWRPGIPSLTICHSSTVGPAKPKGGVAALSDKPEPACEGCRSVALRPPADATRPGRRNGSV